MTLYIMRGEIIINAEAMEMTICDKNAPIGLVAIS